MCKIAKNLWQNSLNNYENNSCIIDLVVILLYGTNIGADMR